MTTENIEVVMNDCPALNFEGMGFSCFPKDREAGGEARRAALMEAACARLRRSAESCTKVAEWLLLQPRTKRPNPRVNGYGTKHVYERQTGHYVSNGEFICACIHVGIPIRVYPDSINVAVGLSTKACRLEAAG